MLDMQRKDVSIWPILPPFERFDCFQRIKLLYFIQCYFNDTVFGKIIFTLVILVITLHSKESVGVMVMCWTLNKVLGSIPTGFTVLCP